MDDLVLDEDEPTQPSTELALVNQELKVVEDAVRVALGVKDITVDFKSRRETLIANAAKFTKPPESEEEQSVMLKAQRDLSKLRTEVTKQGEALKAPLNAARTKIIEIVKEGVEAIQKAEAGIQGKIQNYQQKLLDEQRRIEQEQALADRRAQEEAAEAQRLQSEAEKQRQAAELAKTEAEATALREQAAKLEDQALEKGLSAETSELPIAVQQEAPKAREVFDFEIIGKTDIERKASLSALASAAPWMFTVHVSDEKPRAYSLNLSVRTLTESLNGNPPLKEPLPGIRTFTRLTNLR